MSKTIRKFDRSHYHGDDCRCCRLNKRKGKKYGCGFPVCRYNEIHEDALVYDRAKRKRGWNK